MKTRLLVTGLAILISAGCWLKYKGWEDPATPQEIALFGLLALLAIPECMLIAWLISKVHKTDDSPVPGVLSDEEHNADNVRVL